jgi:hypothetical protein
MLVQVPNRNDNLLADEGILHFHGIRDPKLALDAAVLGLFGVSSPRLPKSL